MFFNAINFFFRYYRFNSLESFGRGLQEAPLPIAGERYVEDSLGTEHLESGSPDVQDLRALFRTMARPAQPDVQFGLRYDVR